MPGGRTLTLDEATRVREALKALRSRYTTQKDLADAVGMSQQAISHALSGGPPGLGLARRLADLLRVSLDDLLDGPAASGERVEYDRTSIPQFRNHRDWPTALASAKERFGRRYSDRIWDLVGLTQGFDVDHLDEYVLQDWAATVERTLNLKPQTPDEARREAEQDPERVPPPVPKKKK